MLYRTLIRMSAAVVLVRRPQPALGRTCAGFDLDAVGFHQPVQRRPADAEQPAATASVLLLRASAACRYLVLGPQPGGPQIEVRHRLRGAAPVPGRSASIIRRLRHDHGAFHAVLQLAHIARPVVRGDARRSRLR